MFFDQAIETDKQRWQRDQFSLTSHLDHSFSAAFKHIRIVRRIGLNSCFYRERHKLQYWSTEFELPAELQDQFSVKNFSLSPNPGIFAVYTLFYAFWISKVCILQSLFILFCIMTSPQYFPDQHLNLRVTTYCLVASFTQALKALLLNRK